MKIQALKIGLKKEKASSLNSWFLFHNYISES